MNVLMIDNYDSFTYNLVHYIEAILDTSINVVRNDKIDLQTITQFDRIFLSPGPGLPKEAGKLMAVIDEAVKNKIPVFGICLGHQAIAEYFGAKLTNIEAPLHGVLSDINILDNNSPLFRALPEKFKVAHYHSWVVNDKTLPESLKTTAKDNHNYIMALEHCQLPVFGVQFHPESILTEHGKSIIANFLYL